MDGKVCVKLAIKNKKSFPDPKKISIFPIETEDWILNNQNLSLTNVILFYYDNL